jgi:hypothetical protein
MKALFLSMQIESSKLDPLRFNGSAADRVSVILKRRSLYTANFYCGTAAAASRAAGTEAGRGPQEHGVLFYASSFYCHRGPAPGGPGTPAASCYDIPPTACRRFSQASCSRNV